MTVDIAYREVGTGRPLVLLHAFPLGMWMWDAQCEALSPARRVVRFDARMVTGFASTTTLRCTATPGMDAGPSGNARRKAATGSANA